MCYTSDLGFQWVEVSNVLPGEYWLREDVNPTGVIKEAGGANVPVVCDDPDDHPGLRRPGAGGQREGTADQRR